MNQVILIIIIKFLAISTHGFPSFFFFSGEVEMICQTKLESLYCEVYPDQTYSTDGSSFDENLKGWMLVSLYLSLVLSDRSWSAGARVNSNTRSVYRACG